MIYIQGAEAPPILAGITGVERDIYVRKRNSPTHFYYATVEALRFELQTRAAIVESARALGYSGAAFEVFELSRCNERYWSRTANGGFELRPGVSPTAAVEDIFVNGRYYAFECATAIIIILYKAVKDMIGREAFDRSFGRLYLYSWNHDTDLRLITVSGKGEAFPGDVQYFKNPQVDPREMQYQGENVIVMPGGGYFGHGIGVTSAEYIVSKLNEHRLPFATQGAFLLDEATFPDFGYLQALAGGPAGYNLVQTAAGPAAWGTPSGPYRVRARIGSRAFWRA
ncbi:protein-glutamine gamma-glutamyltransferase [Paenibacillus puerhi]|uniref:protein-glutamine gamma-glutamyltransferase n=1 Tax=Paenibacillus puerhi TaxID=2692622 RepID=UPI001914F076|nr:protein-glutamine gamma-glutamyltransferase [Paenibacillus puerhi]